MRCIKIITKRIKDTKMMTNEQINDMISDGTLKIYDNNYQKTAFY